MTYWKMDGTRCENPRYVTSFGIEGKTIKLYFPSEEKALEALNAISESMNYEYASSGIEDEDGDPVHKA